MLPRNDPSFIEIYQHRMNEIQDVSDVVSIANSQLNHLLQKLGWSRQSISAKSTLVKCPIDSLHDVKKDKLEGHMKICSTRKNNMMSVNSKDFLPSSSFFYEASNIVSVNLSEQDYANVGVKVPGSNEGRIYRDADDERKTYLNVKSLFETNEEICSYNPCDSLDELRFIYSWSKIPPKYFNPNVSIIQKEQLSQWLIENLPGTDRTGNTNKNSMASFTINQLQKTKNPDELVQLLLPVIKTKTTDFVLKLWKFICAKALCQTQHIPEHTRNEFDHYSNASVSEQRTKELSTIADVSTLSLLPNEWTIFTLNREQRLKLYEQIIEAGKMLTQDDLLNFEELKNQAEEQMKVINEFETKNKGEKTHLEVMAELRNYKRRRLSYRGKNRDSRKMSGVEVLRELVDQQMLYLKILRQPSTNLPTVDEKEETNRNDDYSPKINERKEHRERSRSRARSRSRSRSYERRRRRSRSRSRQRERDRSRDHESHLRHKSQRRKSRSRSRDSSRRNSRRSDSRNSRDIRKIHTKELSNITYYD